MKLLHTADLHLGRLFHEYPLIEDQEYMLQQLIETAEQGAYDGLIISGDIYDRSIPSPEAVDLFSTFLEQLRKRCPGLNIFVIPGNHDSASRLGFGSSLFSTLGIHIVSDPENSDKPIIIEGASGESMAVFLLPFLTPGSLTSRETTEPHSEDSGDLPLRSQQKLSGEASERLKKALDKTMADYSVLAAHLFTFGGKESESERIFLGTAEQIDAGLFSGFDYVALGHLHECQRVLPNMWYAGSPLVYSFNEAEQEKAFVSIEFSKCPEQDNHESGDLFSGTRKKTRIRVSKIPVKPFRKVFRLKGTFSNFFSSTTPVPEEVRNGYIEISLEDATLVENPLALLRSRFPHILSIRQDEAFTGLSRGYPGEPIPAIPEHTRRGLTEDFQAFLEEIYGQADPEKTGLFQKLLKEFDHEAG